MAYYDSYGYGFKPYVPVAARRARAARELAKLQKKGRKISPVVVEGRTIARTFWGEAWCDNLERYSDFANRLPRGRTYVRNGSVVDLQVGAGRVTAIVSGSDMYNVKVTVEPVSRAHWSAICKDCSGAIDSLVELLQGRLSKGVMSRLCQEKTGLFPSPKDIVFTCSCPDWAYMCKHVAAVLYGIGARLDQEPELLFALRRVDQQDLITGAGSDLSKRRREPTNEKVLSSDDLGEMFGIEIAPVTEPKPTAGGVVPKAAAVGRISTPRRFSPAPIASSGKAKAQTTPSARSPEPTVKRPRGRQRLTPAMQQAVAERMRKYWAERRALAAKRKRSRES